jgi:transcriptional regulator NrdR
MMCPFCRNGDTSVIDSRASQDFVIRRRRKCLSCERRFTTYEKIEDSPLKVIKKDGSRVPFDREKIKSGLEKACYKRPISDEQMEAITNGRSAMNRWRQSSRTSRPRCTSSLIAKCRHARSVRRSWKPCGASITSPSSASPRFTVSSRTSTTLLRNSNRCARIGDGKRLQKTPTQLAVRVFNREPLATAFWEETHNFPRSAVARGSRLNEAPHRVWR